MIKAIEQTVLGNLNWLVSRFKSFSVKFVGFVVTCWVVIGAIWIGLVLPVNLINVKMFHRNEAKVVVSKEALSKQGSDYRVNTVASRSSYQVPVSISRVSNNKPVIRDEIRNVTNTVNELRRFGQGVESLVSR
jgi:hypothetical protein